MCLQGCRQAKEGLPPLLAAQAPFARLLAPNRPPHMHTHGAHLQLAIHHTCPQVAHLHPAAHGRPLHAPALGEHHRQRGAHQRDAGQIGYVLYGVKNASLIGLSRRKARGSEIRLHTGRMLSCCNPHTSSSGPQASTPAGAAQRRAVAGAVAASPRPRGAAGLQAPAPECRTCGAAQRQVDAKGWLHQLQMGRVCAGGRQPAMP